MSGPSCFRSTAVAVVGAGIAGIATAYYLAVRHGLHDLLLFDSHQPMGLTSAQSGENYRNWWPHPVMTAFTDHSIDLMEELARETGNRLKMTRRGYLLATRRAEADDLIAQLRAGYGAEAERLIRIHEPGASAGYQPAQAGDWETAANGVDVIRDRALIRRAFPSLDPEVATLLHVRRAGDVDSQQLGQLMLERLRAAGGRRITGRVRALSGPGPFVLEIEGPDGIERIRAERLVNAAGPFAGEVAALLGQTLPLSNILQQKIAFEDGAGAIPRHLPFVVNLDGQSLDWTDDEREALAGDQATAWLAGPLPGAIHCRPDGGDQGRWIKLGWAYNDRPGAPSREPQLDPAFPEIVLRGAARLHPALKAYYGRLPRRLSHYGGYYTMTRENWPLIGPLDLDGAFVVGALSGFGTMAACAAGALCAAWIAGGPRPAFAEALSLARYRDRSLMAELAARSDKGLL